MSPNAIVAFVVLPLVGALIAWAGDVIGYRLGKRRVSLFGLRPRSTARLIGLLFGAGLPLLGLLVAMVLSPAARIALLELDELTRELASLRTMNEQLSDANASLQQKRRDLSAEVEDVRGQSEELQKQVISLDEKSGKLEGEVAQLERARADLSARVAQSESQYRAAEKSLHEKEAELNAAQSALSRAEGSLSEVRQRLEQTEGEAAALERKNRELEQVRTQLEGQVGTLQQSVSGLQAEVEGARGNLAKLNSDMAALNDDLAQKQAEIDEKLEQIEFLREARNKRQAELELRQAELDRLSAEYEEYRRRQTGIAARPVVYETGDVLVRVKARTADADQDLSRWLVELLEFASVAAERRGAVRGPNGRAVLLVAPVPPDVDDRRATELESLEYLTKSIESFPTIDEWVVSVIVFRRFVVGEIGQVHVRMIAQPNERVFAKDEVIAEAVIPAGSDSADVFTTLWVLLRVNVRQEAIRRNMLPEPDTGQYGAVDSRELFDVIEQIEQLAYNVRVKVVPIRDTYTADPMKIRFIIHREPQPRTDVR